MHLCSMCARFPIYVCRCRLSDILYVKFSDLFISHTIVSSILISTKTGTMYISETKKLMNAKSCNNLLSPFVVQIISKASLNTFLVIPMIKPLIY